MKLIEGKDYSVNKFITKNKKKINQQMCSNCTNCNNKTLCNNRKTLYSMKKCDICANCTNKEDCDKYYIYVRYFVEIINPKLVERFI